MADKDGRKKRRDRWIAGIGLGIFLALFLAVAWSVGKPLLEFVSEPERFRQWVTEQGAWGPVLFILMMGLQVIVTIIPGGPFEVAAGYAFGSLMGTVYCIIATTVAGGAVFLAVRKWGVPLVEIFVPIEQVRELPVIRDDKKLHLWGFILMLIPGTPKDALSYAMGLTRMPFWHWVGISAVARIPAIALSVVGGDALESRDYRLAVIVLVVTVVTAAAGVLAYRRIARNDAPEDAGPPEEHE